MFSRGREELPRCRLHNLVPCVFICSKKCVCVYMQQDVCVILCSKMCVCLCSLRSTTSHKLARDFLDHRQPLSPFHFLTFLPPTLRH